MRLLPLLSLSAACLFLLTTSTSAQTAGAASPVVTLRGPTSEAYREPVMAPDTIIDATRWTSAAVGPPPVGSGGVAVELGPKDASPGVNKAKGLENVTWRGGVVRGSIPPEWSWHRTHSFGGSGVTIHNHTHATWEFLRVHNVEDGIKPREAPEWSNRATWLLRDSYFTAIRDDSIENDRFEPGTVQDCLFDGVHTFLSEQKESGFLNGGGRPVSIGPEEDDTIHVRRCFVRIYPTNAFDPQEDKFPGGGRWFKWKGDRDGAPPPSAPNHQVVIEDSVFAVGAVPRLGWGNLAFPVRTTWRGRNFILWLGKTGGYEGPRPAGVTFLEGEAAAAKWVAVRNQWLKAHGLPAQDFPADYNSHLAPAEPIPASKNARR